MEKLTITNFLSIHFAEIEVRRINLWIGPQASGKSIIAKLLYFFKKEIGREFKETIRAGQGKREFKLSLAAKFEAIFPRAYWESQALCIHYTCGELSITIERKRANGRAGLSFNCSDWLYRLQSNLKKRHQLSLEEAKKPTSGEKFQQHYISFGFDAFIGTYIHKLGCSENFEDQIFIPASRTFFATLQKNIFSFLASEINIDYFLKEFGSIYERTKLPRSGSFRLNLNVQRDIEKLMESIIAGRYAHEKEQDWIISESRKINLANASSGQQESLPMLLVLSDLPFIRGEKTGFFIEEPEAHLFPVSQQAFISLLALIANETKHQFFITTHSPYLLTALNNCIIAHATYEATDEAGKEKVLALMPRNQHIAFTDVAAWTVTDKGTVESILDEELQIIGASVLDGVSQHFETVTNRLLDIRYGETS